MVQVKIKYMSQEAAQEFVFSEPYILVSIRDPGSPEPVFRKDPNRIGVHFALFNDVADPKRRYNPKYPLQMPITEISAREIVDFVMAYLDKVSLIAVHCKHGTSRSVGVAAALTSCLLGKESVQPYFKLPLNEMVMKEVILAYRDWLEDSRASKK